MTWLCFDVIKYVVLYPNGEEFFNIFFSPDPFHEPDHLRGEQSRGYNTVCVKKKIQSEQ